MSSKNLDTIEDLSSYLRSLFNNDVKTIILHAFNTTGKTRLASTFRDDIEDEGVESIIYSALFEDMFSWDNEINELHFKPEYSWILKTLRDEGLDRKIIDNFRRHTSSRVEPSIDFNEGSVSFSIASGDDKNVNNIKISRGEESLLIWSIFYTLLELAVEILYEDTTNRATEIFNSLKYVIIDDPVSSMDDAKIISIAIDIVDITKKLAKKNINTLIMTHHALFYNVIANSNLKRDKNFKRFNLYKTQEGLVLDGQDDSPFAYHLFSKDLIQKAIDSDNIERYHFNLFRALLEKTANFLGYDNWADCLHYENSQKLIRTLHLNSHGKLSELEPRVLSNDDKQLFISAFNQFIKEYKWKNIN